MKLNKRERIVVLLGLAFIVLTLYGVYYLAPKLERIRTTNASIAANAGLFDQADMLHRQAQQLDSHSDTLWQQIDLLAEQMPPAHSDSALLASIQRLTQGIVQSDALSFAPTADFGNGLTLHSVTISGSTSEEGLRTLLQRVEDLPACAVRMFSASRSPAVFLPAQEEATPPPLTDPLHILMVLEFYALDAPQLTAPLTP